MDMVERQKPSEGEMIGPVRPELGSIPSLDQKHIRRVTNGSLRRQGVHVPERKEPVFTKRNLLRAGLTLGGAMLAGGFILRYGNEETDILKTGIENDYGTFYPLYHSSFFPNSISEDEIPQGLDVIFRDYPMSGEDFNKATSDPLKFLGDMNFQKSFLEKLADQGTRIVFGNANIDYAPVANWVIPAVETAAALSFGGATRRNFGGFIFTALAILSMGRVSDLAVAGDPNRDAATRTAFRLGARLSAFHPENRGIYLSDAKMAHAMMLSAFHLRLELGRNPKIGINIGAEHNNVEEFLKPGQEFNAVRSAITDTNVWGTSYPIYSPEFLKDLVKNTGGLGNFCSAVEITLPPNFQMSQTLNDPIRKKEVNAQIKVRRYVPDNVLTDLLKKKGVS